MAQYSVAIDAVALSQIINEVDKQRRAKDFVTKLAVLKKTAELNSDGSKAGDKFLGVIKVLEDAGLSTEKAVLTFGGIMDVFEKNREDDDNDT